MLKSTWIALLVLSLALLGFATGEAQKQLTAEDHAEIRQLYATYNLALDGGDAEGWADTFIEDGAFGDTEGHAALVGFAENSGEQQNGNARHVLLNVVERRCAPRTNHCDRDLSRHAGQDVRRVAVQVPPRGGRSATGKPGLAHRQLTQA